MKLTCLSSVLLLAVVYSVKCSDYCDSYYVGTNYNSGKYCSGASNYCCGNCTYRYCCKDQLQQLNQDICTNGYLPIDTGSYTWVWIVFGVVPFALILCSCILVCVTRTLVQYRMAKKNGTTIVSQQQPTTNIMTYENQQPTTVIPPPSNNSNLNNMPIYQIKYQPENSANFSESDPPNYWSAVSGIPDYTPNAETNKPTSS